MLVNVNLVYFDGWRDENARAMLRLARSLGTTDELEVSLDGFFGGETPELTDLEKVLGGADEGKFLSTIKAPEGLDFFWYEDTRYWYRDVSFGKAGKHRIADDRFRCLDLSADPEWRALDEAIYAYVPLEALAKGDESVIATMVWADIPLPEEP